MLADAFGKFVVSILLLTIAATALLAQTRTAAPQTVPTPKPVTHADIVRGEYGRYRANNDLLYYNLDIRVDPASEFVSGKNTIRFKMLKDDNRIQLDLYDNLSVDKILQVIEGPRHGISARLTVPTSWIASSSTA